jgi:hypothetical protein
MKPDVFTIGPRDGDVRRASEWLAHVEREAEAHDARARLRSASGIRDEEILERLRSMGVTAPALPVLELVPPVLVGWAEGGMSRLERDRLRAIAQLRGIDESHAAWPLLAHWMLQRPSDEDERALLAALSHRLAQMPARHRMKRRRAVLDHCDAVARAAGRVLGGRRCRARSAKCSRFSRAACRAQAAFPNRPHRPLVHRYAPVR